MAGCKGLLIVDPQSNSDEFYIKIRPSMNKFECNDWTLDICDYSRASINLNILFQFSKRKKFILAPTRLNNQIILLMSDLGVPDETFFRLQKKWFNTNPSRSTYSK
jgi:hypothetical protein